VKLNLCSGQRLRSIYIAMSTVSYRVFSYVGNVDACKGCMHALVDQLDLQFCTYLKTRNVRFNTLTLLCHTLICVVCGIVAVEVIMTS